MKRLLGAAAKIQIAAFFKDTMSILTAEEYVLGRHGGDMNSCQRIEVDNG